MPRRRITDWGWRRQPAGGQPRPTPLRRRAPVMLVLLVIWVLALLVVHPAWLALAVLLAAQLSMGLFLRYVLGWPWSRVLRWEEP